jgi:aminoglycoside phosphotransferase (APT) family kinase protein
MDLWLERMAGEVDERAVRARWAAALEVPPPAGPPLWLHGDLHPANVLVDGGAISAVIDFGDLTAGDRATDLAGAWSLLPASARATFRAEAGEVDDATWARAEGWALLFAMAYLANSADHPLLARVGRTMLVDLLG